MPYTPHGGLLVPYPEEMANAARPKPPSWVPVVIFTFFFGAFGAISAARRAAAARRTRNDRHPYWIAFGATMAVGLMASAIVVAFFTPVYLDMREEAATKALESNVLTTTKGKSASCRPIGKRAATDGLRPYRCTVILANGRTSTMQIKADKNGDPKTAA